MLCAYFHTSMLRGVSPVHVCLHKEKLEAPRLHPYGLCSVRLFPWLILISILSTLQTVTMSVAGFREFCESFLPVNDWNWGWLREPPEREFSDRTEDSTVWTVPHLTWQLATFCINRQLKIAPPWGRKGGSPSPSPACMTGFSLPSFLFLSHSLCPDFERVDWTLNRSQRYNPRKDQAKAATLLKVTVFPAASPVPHSSFPACHQVCSSTTLPVRPPSCSYLKLNHCPLCQHLYAHVLFYFSS